MTDYCYASQAKLWYGYHRDSHTSLIGSREIASQSAYFQSDLDVEHWLQGSNDVAKYDSNAHLGLFAFPGQSNLTGRRLPIEWCRRLRYSEHSIHRRVYTLLDAAALASTAEINLGDHGAAPDFTAISLYKIFGYPDLGALLVRKESAFLLRQRRFFGGGTVDMVINSTTAADDWVARKIEVSESNEDGTLPFHSIIALSSAIAVHGQLYGSMANVSAHTGRLTQYLYERMKNLRHGNGLGLCTIYSGGKAAYGDSKRQGAVIAFNLTDHNGYWIRKSDVEALAIANNIQLRTGGVCNPGGIANALDLSAGEMKANYAEGLRCGNNIDILNGKPTGVVRVSLGAMTTIDDCDALLAFLNIFVHKAPEVRPYGMMAHRARFLSPGEDGSTSESARASFDPACEEKIPWLCPVATCRRLLETQDTAIAHFHSHRRRIAGRKARFTAFWRGYRPTICGMT